MVRGKIIFSFSFLRNVFKLRTLLSILVRVPLFLPLPRGTSGEGYNMTIRCGFVIMGVVRCVCMRIIMNSLYKSYTSLLIICGCGCNLWVCFLLPRWHGWLPGLKAFKHKSNMWCSIRPPVWRYVTWLSCDLSLVVMWCGTIGRERLGQVRGSKTFEGVSGHN